jgi:HTH-type transcriptional regulator/antitoxin HigA
VHGVRIIQNKRDHRAALLEIERIWAAPDKSPEAELLSVLALLVEHYEKTNFPIEDPDPIELLEHVMQSRGLTRKDFEPAFGQKGRVAEIFNRVSPLSLEMIRSLVEQFDLPADVLVKPYALRGGIGQTLSLQLPL